VTEAEGENEEVDTANKKTKKKIPKVISDAVRSAQARKANSKGLGKAGVSKRHQRQMALKKDVIMGITNPALSRLARRGGVKRISQGVYDFARETIQNDLRVTLQVAATYANHARRKTITSMDVLYSLKKRGREIYGCGVIAW
jgi:histone H3/H4